MTIKAVSIDAEFRDLIPPLSEQELAGLESSLVAEGCRDALVTWRGILLDGHNRKTICDRHGISYNTVEVELPDRTAAMLWIIDNQLSRRNLTVYARGELALKREPILAEQAKANQKAGGQSAKVGRQKSAQPLKTRDQVAASAGVSHDTIAKVKFIRDNGDEATKQRLRTDPNLKVHRVAKELREAKQAGQRKAARMEAAKYAPPLDSRIIIGDFRKHADKVADGSVRLILTDPPYDREASKMLPALAEFAAAKLSDGGSLICYVGQTQLPAAMDALRSKLRYWWTICCLHSGGATVMREYGITNQWKAILWFVKGTRDDKNRMIPDVVSGGKEKSHHDWQQAQSEARQIIDGLTDPGDLVCDPFLGGGTTAAAAKATGRQWIGFEIDQDTAAIAGKRLSA